MSASATSKKLTGRDCSKGRQKNKKVGNEKVRVFTWELITGPAGAKAAAETASAATTADRSIVQDGQANGEFFPKFVPGFLYQPFIFKLMLYREQILKS